MDRVLKIQLLGTVQLTIEGKPLTGLSSRKAAALLVYLAWQQRPFPRELLADFLWDDRPQDQALANLRSILSSMRGKLKPYLHITRDEVAFNAESHYWLDTAVFEAQLSPLLASLGQDEVLTETAVSQLTAALDLYHDDFLAGFFISDSIGFDEWATVQRERYQRMAILALRHLANHYINSGQYQLGLQTVPRLLHIDPLNETAHRQMMTLLARTGQRHAALQQYQQCRSLLARELVVAPATATTALYERIKRAPELPPLNLPASLSPIIGREKEVAQIIERLNRPSCRLLTLLGPGGVGKTRLAVAAASQMAGAFLDGIFFIPLAPLETADLLPILLSEILNLPLTGSQPPQTQLQNHLRHQELLLVVDNAEHLLPQLDLLIDILHSAPQVKLLVTSRERFNVQMEWILPIDGLPYPQNGGSREVRYPAAALFAERALKAGTDLQLVGETATAVHRICQLVQGNPLGLELAAAATYTFTPTQIASQITHNLDFLVTTLRDVPSRHRSVRAVFESSWQLLTPDEQQLFIRLSLFRGGFTAAAAAAIADIPPATLTSFAHKSLLQTEADGRYDLHDLLRQFIAEKLTAADRAATQSRYVDYFSHFLAERNEPLRSQRQKEALDEVTADIENIRAFWQQATSQQNLAAIGRSLVALYRFYDTAGWFQEGYQAFATAVERLQPIAHQLDRQQTIAFAHLLSRQGWFLSRLDRRLEAAEFLQRSLDLYRQVGDTVGESIALNDLGIVVYRLGDYARSKQLALDGLAIARAQNDDWKTAVTLTNLGNVCRAMGDYAEAQAYLQEGTDIMRQHGDKYSLANSLNNLGEVARALGAFAEAKACYEESLAIRYQVDDQFGIGFSLNNLGTIAYNQGRTAEARRLYHQSLEIFQELKADSLSAHPLSGLGRLARDDGHYQDAIRYYQQAVRALDPASNAPKVLNVLFEAATVLLQTGTQLPLAYSLLNLVNEHPKTNSETRQAAQAYQPKLAPDILFDEAIEAVLALQLVEE
ncbi:MAG: tetratricopeptide repeat protein [Ardenticatenaceae bacterium]|nr:tetratricopeptide repeat protein [Ardenticatenaceae bacterium]